MESLFYGTVVPWSLKSEEWLCHGVYDVGVGTGLFYRLPTTTSPLHNTKNTGPTNDVNNLKSLENLRKF